MKLNFIFAYITRNIRHDIYEILHLNFTLDKTSINYNPVLFLIENRKKIIQMSGTELVLLWLQSEVHYNKNSLKPL